MMLDIFNKVRENFSRTFGVVLQPKHSPGFVLSFIVYLTGLIMVIPLIYIIVRSIEAEPARWLTLLDTRIPSLLQQTLSLTFVVTIFATIIGITLAVLVSRTDLPGKKIWKWLLVVPLTIPPYVGAMTYIIIFGPRGWIYQWFDTTWNIYSFSGVAFVLIGFTYPYVYLIVSASLRKINRSMEEVGLVSGYSQFSVLRKVTLPLLIPAIGSGALLVALYVVSDFGAVAMMRYPTFTQAIYFQMGSFDRSGAAILSVILIIITAIFLVLQYFSKRRMKFYQIDGANKKAMIIPLGKYKGLAVGFVSLIFFLFALLPIVVLLYWTFVGWTSGAINSDFFGYAWNSFSVAILTALICIVLSLPLVYVKNRYESFASRLVDGISYASYALPGVIVALGVIFVFINYLPWAYGTIAVLVVAYILRFLPQALQSSESALNQISPRIDEASMSLGRSPLNTMVKVILVLMRPGILAGSALVLVSVIKELPATLLLRTAGFDTLAVRVWIEASEGYYDAAAPSALLIIIISILPIRWMLNKY